MREQGEWVNRRHYGYRSLLKFDGASRTCSRPFAANIYLFKGNNINSKERCEISSKLTCSSVFIVNFEHISPFSIVSIVDFEQRNASWVVGCECHIQSSALSFEKSICIRNG